MEISERSAILWRRNMQAREIHLVRFYKVKATFPIGNVATIYIVLFMLVALFKSVVFFFLCFMKKFVT